jgi:hypothetical protein
MKTTDETPCPRCKGEMRVIDNSMQINGGYDKYENEDGKMPCPTCEGNG